MKLSVTFLPWEKIDTPLHQCNTNTCSTFLTYPELKTEIKVKFDLKLLV